MVANLELGSDFGTAAVMADWMGADAAERKDFWLASLLGEYQVLKMVL